MAYGSSRVHSYRVKEKKKDISSVSSIRAGEKNRGGLLGGLGYVGGSIAAGVGGIGEGIIDLLSAGGALLTGDVDYAKYVFKDNVVGDWHEELTNDFNPGTGWKFAGDVASGIGQSATLFIPYAGAPLFFAGVMSQGISGAAAKTGDVGLKEVAYGVTSGAIEGTLEMALGAAGKGAKSIASSAAKSLGKNSVKGLAKSAVRRGVAGKLLSGAAGEFVEEAISEAIDPMIQRLYQIDPNASTSMKDVLYAGLVGAVSGAVTTGAVEILKSASNRARGAKVIRNGNSQTLVNSATILADRLAGAGTDFKNAPEWVRTLRGEIDAYNELAKKGKQNSASAETILGEMQASVGFAEMQAINAGITAKIKSASEADRAALAEYINMTVDAKNRPKTYTAEDIAKDTDGVATQLAIMEFAGSAFDIDGAMDVSGDVAQESAIASVIAEESGEAPSAESRVPNEAQSETDPAFEQAMARAEVEGEIKHSLSKTKTERLSGVISDLGKKRISKQAGNKKIIIQTDDYTVNKNVFSDKGRKKSEVNARIKNIDNFEQLLNQSQYAGSDTEIHGVDNDAKKGVVAIHKFKTSIDGYNIEFLVRDKGKNQYLYEAKFIENKNSSQQSMTDKTASPAPDGDVENNKSIPQTEPVVNPSGEKKYSVATAKRARAKIKENEARAARNAVKTTQKSGEASEKAVESRSQERGAEAKNKAEAAEKKAQTDDQKISQSKEAQTDEQRAERAKARAEAWIEWEKNTRPTAKELNTVREYVKGFDNLSNPRRLEIIRMIRSAKGVDAKIVKGVANLMAIKAGADLEIRFDEKISNEGVTVPMGDKTLILIGTSADFKKTIKGTVAHELVHYLERKPGYKAFAEHVMKHVKPEVRARVEAEVTKDYNEFYTERYRAELEKQGLSGKKLDKAVKDKLASAEHKALIDSEVVANLVGRALDNEKFLSRYARIGNNDSFIKRAYNFLRGMVKELRSRGEESEEARELADIIMPTIKSMDRLLQMPTVKKAENGTKYATGSNSGYDYTKPFYQQVEDYKNGLFPKDDSLLLGETPDVFKSIGFNSLPMTINQRHVDYALNGTKDVDHEIGEILLKYLPTALKNPVAIIISNTKKSTSVVAIISITHKGSQINVPIYVDGTGTLNGIEIDSNAITSVYAKSNAITKLLNNALNEELNGNIGIYYWDKKRAVALLSGKKVPMPNTLNALSDGSIHSIRENASPVKPKFENVTESQQFKRWFGKSKVVNADGTPKILYHQTSEDFTVFDPRHKGAGTNDDETPFGIFMKPADNDIGLKGKKQMALYARIVKPLIVNDRADLVYRLKSLSPKYEELIKQRNALSVEYKTKLEKAAKAWGQYAKDYRANHPDATRTDIYNDPEFKKLYDAEDLLTEEWIEKADDLSLQMKEEITKTLKDNDYDGVILKNDAGSGGRTVETYIALEPTQVKSATNNIGTFDKNNPDIRYSLSKKNAGSQTKNDAETYEKKYSLAKNTPQKMREKMARERAESAKNEQARVFAKKDVKIAVDSIEGWTQEEVLSLAKGQELQGMSRAKREEMISQIYVALHEEGAKGRVGPGSVAVKTFAAKIANDYLDSAQIKGADGKSVHLSEIYDELSINRFKQELTDLLYGEFANMGQTTQNAEFQAIIRAQKESFLQDQLNDKLIGRETRNLAYQGKKLRELVENQKRDGAAEDISKVTKRLAAVVDAKGNIRVNAVDEAMKEASRFFDAEKMKAESAKNMLKTSDGKETRALSDFAWEQNEELKFMIDEYVRLRRGREGRALSTEELKLAAEVLRGMKTTLERYNKEFINGHWVDVDEAAKACVADLTAAWRDKEYKNKAAEILGGTVDWFQEKYFYKILTPETVVETLEGYAKSGILKQLYHSIRVHKQRAEHLAVQMKKPLAEFIDSKDNRYTDKNGREHSFRKKLNEKQISIDGANITLGEAIYLYMLTKREEAHTGLLENGYIVFDDKNQRRATIAIPDIETVRSNIYNQLDKTDIEFLKLSEDFFNKTASKIKYDADMNIFGYTNIRDGYYVPMIRDRYSRMNGVTDARQSIGSIITVYNKSFNQNLVENARALEGKNIMSIINDHADGLADYAELYLPLKAFDRTYNRAVGTSDGSIRSIREVLNNDVWNGTERYFKDLFADIQGQREQRDDVVNNLVGKIRSGWVNSVLGANLKVVATQTTSLVSATQVIGAKYIAKCSYLASPGKIPGLAEIRARAYEYSDIIEARSFDMGALKSQGNVDKINAIGEKTGWAIGWMDERICLAVFHAAELQIQEQKGYAVGTPENAERAARLADEAIYTTQAMSSASERSALQRSTNEIGKMLSMFTADSVKNLSHLYGNINKWNAYKARVKSGDVSYEAEMKKAGKDIRRSVRTLACTGIMLGLIAQGFKYLYGREEEEPEDKQRDFIADIAGSTLNILPIVSDIADKLFFDYDMSLNVLDVANDTLEAVSGTFKMAGNAMKGEYVSTKQVIKNSINVVKSVGSFFGLPITPVERTVSGLLRFVSPEAAYSYNSNFGAQSYTSDLQAAVESGDERLAEHVLEQLYRNEVAGVYTSAELEEIVRLFGLTDDDGKHYNVLPQKIGTEINGVVLNKAQRKQFEKVYSQASVKVNELIRSEYYQELNDEQRAKAIKNLYALYYNRAASEVTGAEWTRAQAYSLLTDNYAALFASQAYKSGLEAVKDASGKEVTVKSQNEAYLKSLGLSDSDYVVISYANGMRSKSNRSALLAHINSLALSDEQKAKLAEALGFEVKNGKVVEKEE